MSKPLTINWPAAVTNAICLTQTTTGAGNLLINGTLSTGTPNGYSQVLFANSVLRTVSITSANNNSTLNFTITGTNQGNTQTETLSGPNATTVYTTNLFDSVISVSVNGATVGAGVSVGTGTTGFTDWISYNYHASVAALSTGVSVSGTINYSFQYTLDNVNSNSNPVIYSGIPSPDTTGPNAFRLAMSGSTTTDFAYLNYPVGFYRVKVNSASTGALTISFVQQGID